MPECLSDLKSGVHAVCTLKVGGEFELLARQDRIRYILSRKELRLLVLQNGTEKYEMYPFGHVYIVQLNIKYI